MRRRGEEARRCGDEAAYDAAVEVRFLWISYHMPIDLVFYMYMVFYMDLYVVSHIGSHINLIIC